MKANQLSVGDFVTFDDCVKEGDILPIRIQSIHYYDDEILATIGGEESCDILELNDEIVGIPITAEILEKNGFLYKKLKGIGDNEIWRIEDDYYDIDIYEWSDSIWVFRYDCTEMSLPHTQVVMSYVHELQHAFRLCGIEKEIEP